MFTKDEKFALGVTSKHLNFTWNIIKLDGGLRSSFQYAREVVIAVGNTHF